MASGEQKFKDALDNKLGEKQDNPPFFAALLGDGANNVTVSGRPNYVYYRSGGISGEVYNERVAPANDLPVWIGVDPIGGGKFQVLGTNVSRRRYGEDNATRGLVTAHAKSHTYPAEDTVYIQLRQYLPLRVSATATPSFSVDVYRGIIDISGTNYTIDTQTLDLSGYEITGVGIGTRAKWLKIDRWWPRHRFAR